MDFTKVKKSPILLKEEGKRYAFDAARPVRGYVKLENSDERGFIIAVMDNVKFFPRGEYVYKLLFAGKHRGKTRYHLLGSLSLNAYGKGEGSFRINPQDMDGHGTALWDFNTAVIAAMSTVNGREPLHPVLRGEFSIERQNAAKKSASPHDYSPFYNRFVLENCIMIARRQQDFDSIVPFGSDAAAAHWKKITDLSLFPVISPGSQLPMEKYAHFLWGWNDTHYFLAVPGRFLPEEQPDKGESGFVFWQPILGMEGSRGNDGGADSADSGMSLAAASASPQQQRREKYGYWIATVNRYTGVIEDFPAAARN